MSLLRLDGIFKTFGGLLAVDHVSFAVEEGEIVGLIGPNGAGKTTVFNLITGNDRPDEGRVYFKNTDITGMKPNIIVSLGIARTFQNIRLFQKMSVLENVLAGCHCRLSSGLFSSMFHIPRQKKEERLAVEKAMQSLAFVGLDKHHDRLADSLSYGNQRLLEIARAIASEPSFLILDEPAGGMNNQETNALLELVFAIQQKGISVLLIEHDMGLVMKACDRLVVLEYGAIIAQGKPEKVKENAMVIEAYLGSDGDF